MIKTSRCTRICQDVATPSFTLLVFGPCIVLGPIRGTSKGSCMTLETLLTASTPSLGFGFCFILIVVEQLLLFGL
jgi:hypothetical protein